MKLKRSLFFISLLIASPVIASDDIWGAREERNEKPSNEVVTSTEEEVGDTQVPAGDSDSSDAGAIQDSAAEAEDDVD